MSTSTLDSGESVTREHDWLLIEFPASHRIDGKPFRWFGFIAPTDLSDSQLVDFVKREVGTAGFMDIPQR